MVDIYHRFSGFSCLHLQSRRARTVDMGVW